MKCDKCGKKVSLDNDAVELEVLLGTCSFVCGARHLLPTEDCEGSPSRAQFLEGGTPDPRGYGADLSPEEIIEWQEKYRAAYQKLQERASKEKPSE